MQYGKAEQERRHSSLNQTAVGAPHPHEDHSPQKRKKQILIVLALLFLMGTLLIIMYIAFPKEPAKYISSGMYEGLLISEVMSANSSAVPDENGVFSDWLEIFNGTGNDLDMSGLLLTNRADRITFPFPEYTLKANERVVIFASDRYQLDSSKPFHGKFKLSSAGVHLYLYAPNMDLIDEVIVPTLTADHSYLLTSVDADGTRHYETSVFYSPGFENNKDGFDNYRAANAMESGSLVINEVCPNPKAGIPDENGEMVDWLELKNNTDQVLSLSGYYLSDKENKPMKWRFPEGAAIPAGGCYLVYCSGKNRLQANGVPHTNFSIDAQGESLVLSDHNNRLVDRVSIENVAEDYSVGRVADGSWQRFAFSTPGQENNEQGQAKSDELIRAYNPTGVILSEVMASNDSVTIGAAAAMVDYIELYNSSNNRVDLSFYGLSDRVQRPRKWQFPAGTAIDPGEYKIIYCDSRTDLTTTAELHTNFSISRAGGETIVFCDPAGKVLDRMPLSLIPTDHSYGRTLGYGGFCYYDVPSPGAANGTGYAGYTSNPSFSKRGGEYKGLVTVTISVPDHAQVYYTMDGSIPTKENGSSYKAGESFEISRVTVLRARAFDTNERLQPSEIITQTYLPNLYHAFPIVSLVADPHALWNADTGMLTVGANVDKSKGIPFKNTIYRMVKDELDASAGYVEMYDKGGNQLINQGMEFSLQGKNSLDFPQKSFKVKAKAKYGEKYFSTKLFEDRPFMAYKGFVLRIGGNDSAWTRLIDGFQDRLIDRFNEQSDKPSTVIHQAWRPVVVYLNGTYWGHYNLRERVDRYFVAQHEGLTLDAADEMDVLEASGAVAYGSGKEYKAFIKKVKTLSPENNEADLQYMLDHMDVDNYFDYMAFEMFFGNSDPGNIRFYKLKGEENKWKWIIYDLDYGLFDSGFNSPYSYLKEKGAGDRLIDNTLIRKLLENDRMQAKFLTRLGEIYQTFTTEYMMAVFNEMVMEIEPEMAMHFARWAEETDKAVSFDNPTTPEGALRYWHTRLDRTRNVLKKRPTYFYEMIQKQFGLTDEQLFPYFGEKPPIPDDAEADYVEGVKWG
ncbi:MAG: lamin tail domain-containing protein [Clostridia bacterium]